MTSGSGFAYYRLHHKARSTPAAQGSDKTAQPENQNSQSTQNSTAPSISTQANPTHLTITEWDVRASVPAGLEGKVSYQLTDRQADADNNLLQGVHILVLASEFPSNECTLVDTPQGKMIDSGAIYIQSESSKPFNGSRYRWTFKESILKTTSYNYHLDYLTPDCIGAGTDKIEALQSALSNLQQIK